jgi:hypothetical protein
MPVDATGCGDLRTKAGRKREVIKQVNEYGGFTVFWVTNVHLRAVAADELMRDGIMARGRGDAPFPWCSHVIVGAVGGGS